MLELQKYFRESRNASSRFEMPDIGFHRTYGAKTRLLRLFAPSFCQSGDFNGVSKCGTCPMRFDVFDCVGFDTRAIERVQDQAGVCRRIGDCISARSSA